MSVTIPNSVTSIDANAFEDYTALASITYLGTQAKWEDVTKATGWNDNTGNYTVDCTDGDLAKS